GERLRQLRGADGSRRAAVLQKSQKSAARRLHAGQGVELEEPFQRYRFDEDQILQFVERISDLRLRVLAQSLSQFGEIRGVRGQAQKLPIELGQAALRILTSAAPVLSTLVHPIGVRHLCGLLLYPATMIASPLAPIKRPDAFLPRRPKRTWMTRAIRKV